MRVAPPDTRSHRSATCLFTPPSPCFPGTNSKSRPRSEPSRTRSQRSPMARCSPHARSAGTTGATPTRSPFPGACCSCPSSSGTRVQVVSSAGARPIGPARLDRRARAERSVRTWVARYNAGPSPPGPTAPDAAAANIRGRHGPSSTWRPGSRRRKASERKFRPFACVLLLLRARGDQLQLLQPRQRLILPRVPHRPLVAVEAVTTRRQLQVL